MNRFLFFLPEPEWLAEDRPLRWFRLSQAGARLDGGEAPLTRLANLAGVQDAVVVVVPGERVTLHRVPLPKRARAAALRALPFALEEQLSEDIENLHIVPGRSDASSVLAAVVAHRDMEAWLQAVQAAGLKPRWMLPDTLLLPAAGPGVFHVLAAGGRCLARAEDAEPVAIPADLCAAWQTQEERRLGRTLHRADPMASAAAADSGKPVGTQSGTGPEAFLAEHLRLPPALNLLAGRHAGRNDAGLDWRPWRVPLALAGCAAILGVTSLLLEVRELERSVVDVDDAIVTLFAQTLPGTRLVDPVQQFRPWLEQEGPVSGGPGPVLGPLAALTEVLSQVLAEAPAGEALTLRQVRADAGRLELELDIDSLASLERLRARVAGAGAFDVGILSADTLDEVIRARLRIEALRS